MGYTASPSNSPGFFSSPKAQAFLILFFTLLFFLGSADQFFAVRLFGFNVRWGQFLLLGAALFSLLCLMAEYRKDSKIWRLHLKLFMFWVPFFLSYLLSALSSPETGLTLVKGGWALFNIGGAALVCLNPHWSQALRRGFLYGALSLACLIWVEALAIYWFGVDPTPAWPGTWPVIVHWLQHPVILGYAQPSFEFQGIHFFRPNAFYYEPSYAGSTLAFVFPLFMVARKEDGRLSSFVWPGFVLGATLLVSSRSGILSGAFAVLFLLVLGAIQRQKDVLTHTLKTLGFAVLLLGLFSLSPLGLKYIEFINGPLGADTIQRTNNNNFAGSSEGSRLNNLMDCLQAWNRHLFLGNGVIPVINGQTKGLGQISMNTWMEIGVESGVLGFAAFIFALLATMRESLMNKGTATAWIFILSAWVSHFMVGLNFTQTFPRLDYWLVFYLSVLLLIQPQKSKSL